MRIACLLVPDLPLAAALRAQPELAGRPFVLASGTGPRAQVISASPEALRAGIRPMASLVHARATLPSLLVRLLSPALEQSARAALCDVARSASPRVAPMAPGAGPWLAEAAVQLDAEGTSALFRSEAGLASALVARAAALGLPAVAAVAGSRAASLAAARQLAHGMRGMGSRAEGGLPDRAQGARVEDAGSTCVLPPGCDGERLAALSIDLLDVSDTLATALTRFGVHRLGDLARLPRRGLVTRLGPGVRPLLALAHGETDTLPLPLCEDDAPPEAVDLDAPLDHLEALFFVLNGLLGRLLERLALRGLVANELVLGLGLDGGGRDARHIAVSAPTDDAHALLGLVRLALERRPPTASVVHVSLGAIGAAARRDQLDLFRPAGPAPAALARLVAELEALCGEGCVGTPRLPDDPHPDALCLAPFVQAPAPMQWTPSPAPHPGALVLRALRPAAKAEVHLRDEQPRWLRSRPASGRVVEVAGPWRTTGRWWSPETRYAFDHFDVRTESDALVRLRRDLIRGDWAVDGTYD